jgi:hypothetical protein
MRDGTNSEHFVRLARERGARTVCIDPHMTMSAVALADEWVPIRPGTDTAMMSAMAYVMITERLVDRDFVRARCLGFDAIRMPSGCETDESYEDYIRGMRDGVAKMPDWAQPITGVPRATIARIALQAPDGGPSRRRRSRRRAPLRLELRYPEGRKGGRRATRKLSRGFPCPDRVAHRVGPVCRPHLAAWRGGCHRARCLGPGRAGFGCGPDLRGAGAISVLCAFPEGGLVAGRARSEHRYSS